MAIHIEKIPGGVSISINKKSGDLPKDRSINTDQVGEISAALRDVESAPPGVCVTFDLESEEGCWVQIRDGVINCAYPHAGDPEEMVRKLEFPPISTGEVEWEGSKFATFVLEDTNVDAVAQWIDAYFVRVFGACENEYSISVSFEQL